MAKIPAANINAIPQVTLPKKAPMPRKMTASDAMAAPTPPWVNQSTIVHNALPMPPPPPAAGAKARSEGYAAMLTARNRLEIAGIKDGMGNCS